MFKLNRARKCSDVPVGLEEVPERGVPTQTDTRDKTYYAGEDGLPSEYLREIKLYCDTSGIAIRC